MTQPIKIAYILSVGHSGSSLLDVLLGQSDGAISIGEVKLDHQGLLKNTKCTCGQSIQECGFWRQVEDRLGEHGQSLFTTRFAGDLTTSDYQNIARFYSAIMAVSEAKLVVDSSKSISRLRALGELDGQIDLKLIFLERSPWGVVASNFRKGRNWIKHTFMYLLNNTSKRHFASLSSNLHVSYEAVVENPRQAIVDIYDYLGFDAGVGSPIGTDLSPEKHMLGGNSMLYRPITEIKPDTRWKTELTWFQKLFISVICHPILQHIVNVVVSTVRCFKTMFSR